MLGVIWHDNQASFLFEDTDQRRVDSEVYVSGRACVEPKQFGLAHHNVKQKMWQMRRDHPTAPAAQ